MRDSLQQSDHASTSWRLTAPTAVNCPSAISALTTAPASGKRILEPGAIIPT
jgi:hypothetical protein